LSFIRLFASLKNNQGALLKVRLNFLILINMTTKMQNDLVSQLTFFASIFVLIIALLIIAYYSFKSARYDNTATNMLLYLFDNTNKVDDEVQLTFDSLENLQQ